MRIRGDERLHQPLPSQAKEVQGTKGDRGGELSRSSRLEGDTVEVSEQARALSVAKGALENTPQIRTDKVEALKHSIQAGTYHVSSEKIAERILGEGLFA